MVKVNFSEHFFPIACCELVKVNLTIIIIIQRITHAFEYKFDCAIDKSNVYGSHSNANFKGMHSNALKILWRHSNAQHSNAHSIAFAFVNKPGLC